MSVFGDVATDKARIVAYCSQEMKQKLERLADLRFRSLSNLVEAVLAEEIARAEASGELPSENPEKGKE
ncbi:MULTISPECIES: hypothetical protein [unclassified Leptolyngbya]|uniref:hypothetical protein n=1 Tax=unclassified Leptolyngbya TaxID=2650499 RepID=UPI001685D00C|nr:MULTISPECIES: hypothetical protein [unclassified Leptolyngbya]MBD1913614.1 hypothetical protein [Leptolyngbya sp. FACHB-8]MBD2154055.1 hypothetical protein [Leptolyngbya sp. FACHB-16]